MLLQGRLPDGADGMVPFATRKVERLPEAQLRKWTNNMQIGPDGEEGCQGRESERDAAARERELDQWMST